MTHKLCGGDGRADRLAGVNDFLHARHTERHVHGRDAGKVESLERHLRAGLADGLRAHGTDSLAGLDGGGRVLAHTHAQELPQLRRRQTVHVAREASIRRI